MGLGAPELLLKAAGAMEVVTPPAYSLPRTFLKFATACENLTKIYNLHHLITHLINHPWGKKKAIHSALSGAYGHEA